MTMYRQTKSGTWHILHINRPNCNRYNAEPKWRGEAVEALPEGAKLCKKCQAVNQ